MQASSRKANKNVCLYVVYHAAVKLALESYRVRVSILEQHEELLFLNQVIQNWLSFNLDMSTVHYLSRPRVLDNLLYVVVKAL